MVRSLRLLVVPLLVALVSAAAVAAISAASTPSTQATPPMAPATEPAGRVLETLSYHWRLTGLLRGLLIFGLPGDGEATLVQRDLGNGHESVELYLASDGVEDGEYFRYGSEINVASGEAIRAWSSYRWRGESKSRESRIDQAKVVDIASAIVALRRDPPRQPRHLEIWSDGKLYPVVVVPREVGHRHRGTQEIAARRYEIRPVQLPGRRVWKGGIDLWLAADPVATPVEIRVQRSLASVVLTLDR